MKKLLIISLLMFNSACYFKGKSFDDIFGNNPKSNEQTANLKEKIVKNAPLKPQNSVVVCRSKQCAPASLSMSKEYIYNSLLQLFENNNKSTALICQASPNSRVCLENYITIPVKVGITPANLYIDSVKITDANVGKGMQTIDLLLNYNVTFNGQSPDCTTANTIAYAKSTDHIILEDNGYQCQMTSIGKTTVNTVFSIDYIDLDYGFIGGYYSIGLSGPAYGGGVGYMIIRLIKDAYPLSPVLMKPKQKKQASAEATQQATPKPQEKVKIFPISNK